MKFPKKYSFANLPTPIQELKNFSKYLKKYNKNSPNIFIKRDDFSGVEFSGNKIRKLEYSIMEAKDKGANLLITCGGIQSNHCRATAAIGVRLGYKVVVILAGNGNEPLAGNLFFDKLLGADVIIVSADDFSNNLDEIVEKTIKKYKEKGYVPYYIPVGASNGIGLFGYANCIKEILDQENDMRMKFDSIAVTVGSGGTYGGLVFGNQYFNGDKDIFGINISANKDYFETRVREIIEESYLYLNEKIEINFDKIRIIDGYVGKGYALNEEKELRFIHDFAKMEGILLDPVYTGKAMGGLVNEIKNGKFDNYTNLLFIHTGGIYGLMAKVDEFESFL